MCCPPPRRRPPRQHNSHEVDALDVLAKTPGLYLVPELRYIYFGKGRKINVTDKRDTPTYAPTKFMQLYNFRFKPLSFTS